MSFYDKVADEQFVWSEPPGSVLLDMRVGGGGEGGRGKQDTRRKREKDWKKEEEDGPKEGE